MGMGVPVEGIRMDDMIRDGTGRETLSKQLTDRLGRRILSGEFPPGSRLPTERVLAEEYRVARHVVREALKRLETIGLLRIRQGSGIYVQQMQFDTGVKLFDLLLYDENRQLDGKFLLDVLEFREGLVRAIVRSATRRRNEADLGRLKLLLDELVVTHDEEKQEEILQEYYRVLVEATGNKVYHMVFNTLGGLLIRLRRLFDLPLVGSDTNLQTLREVYKAVKEGNPDEAEQVVARYMAVLDKTVSTILLAKQS